MVLVTCTQLDSAEFLLEPLGFEDEQLPEGVLVSPGLGKEGPVVCPPD